MKNPLKTLVLCPRLLISLKISTSDESYCVPRSVLGDWNDPFPLEEFTF